jgi:hypothetical protein
MVANLVRSGRADVLKLEGASGGDHRGGQQRDDVAGAGEGAEPDRGAGAGHAARGCRGRCGGGGPTARDRARARGGTATAGTADAQQLGDDADWAKRRDERGQLTADAPDL